MLVATRLALLPNMLELMPRLWIVLWNIKMPHVVVFAMAILIVLTLFFECLAKHLAAYLDVLVVLVSPAGNISTAARKIPAPVHGFAITIAADGNHNRERHWECVCFIGSRILLDISSRGGVSVLELTNNLPKAPFRFD